MGGEHGVNDDHEFVGAVPGVNVGGECVGECFVPVVFPLPERVLEGVGDRHNGAAAGEDRPSGLEKQCAPRPFVECRAMWNA
jgi:hypothetical protein